MCLCDYYFPQIICVIASHATAKDRKRLIKSLKGHTLESILHSSAHLGIMRIIDVTDDTVNVQKSMLQEIRATQAQVTYTAAGEVLGTPLPPLVKIMMHPQGCKLLLRLLSPQVIIVLTSPWTCLQRITRTVVSWYLSAYMCSSFRLGGMLILI